MTTNSVKKLSLDLKQTSKQITSSIPTPTDGKPLKDISIPIRRDALIMSYPGTGIQFIVGLLLKMKKKVRF